MRTCKFTVKCYKCGKLGHSWGDKVSGRGKGQIAAAKQTVAAARSTNRYCDLSRDSKDEESDVEELGQQRVHVTVSFTGAFKNAVGTSICSSAYSWWATKASSTRRDL